MYYPPPQSSPALVNKLSSHHDTPWSRSQHPLTQHQHQHQHPSVLGAAPNNVPPQTPSYAIYANGSALHHPGAATAAAMGALQHSHAHSHGMGTHPSMHQHHHQNSLSQHPAYSSPPNGVGHGHTHQGLSGHVMAQTSPTTAGTPIMTQHWQQQLLKYEV
jgi:CCR4-NOT transcription complex subunit 6